MHSISPLNITPNPSRLPLGGISLVKLGCRTLHVIYLTNSKAVHHNDAYWLPSGTLTHWVIYPVNFTQRTMDTVTTS